jgi:RNA polymerase sigma factor (TIGR02999 family)
MDTPDDSSHGSAGPDATLELTRLSGGDPQAVSELMPLVYTQLRALAAAHLRQERPDHTLQPTAIIHEVYLKLVDQTRVNWKDRAHFFAVAAEAIRRILIDHSRGKKAAKRRPPGERVTVSAELDAADSSRIDLLGLDEALQRLSALSPRQAKVVELRFFGGLSNEETASVLNVSEGTVKGDWRLARAWLERELNPDAP